MVFIISFGFIVLVSGGEAYLGGASLLSGGGSRFPLLEERKLVLSTSDDPLAPEGHIH